MSRKFWATALMVTMLGVAAAIPLSAAAPAAPGGGGGGRPNFDPAAFKDMMMARLKDQLGSSDEEFKVLQPAIEKVTTLRMTQMGGGLGALLGRMRPGAATNPAVAAIAANPVSDASKALSDLLANKDATELQIKEKLKALRDAKAKAKEDMTKAQKELQELCTPRQEAVLVQMGMLD